ncbi:hypothetical protein IHN63_02820 [Deinococcus sp. 6YEL10]|uniref:hypothetical protein n=1 Tax=Deinococcus sp. 6YEL10 TaxID=2745870 RepID=UPI001E2F49A0|nr:hypothetical protein [Deinococcus sp. 6YEL10]
MITLRTTVPLSTATVTLHAWSAAHVDAHLLDLLAFTVGLGAMRDHWDDISDEDIDPHLWMRFERLVRASLRGQEPPVLLSWPDRIALLDAMWALNDVDETEGKLTALVTRAKARQARLTALHEQRLQGLQTAPSTST